MKRLSGLLVTGALLVSGVQSAHAQNPQWLQSFVAPSGATSLESFTWSGLSTSDPYTFNLYGFDGTHLTTSALWTQAMTSAVEQSDVQTLYPNAGVTPGSQYAIGLRLGIASQNIPGDMYPGGAFYVDAGDGVYQSLGGGDAQGFSMTFGTTATPEPASLVLLVTGLAGIGVVRRRRTTGR